MNKLLKRQINKYLGDISEIPENIQSFLRVINASYEHYEKDRKLLERSIEISSMEMKELNNKLRDETEEGTKAIYEQLKESLLLLNEDKEQIIPHDLDYHKLSHIAEILKNETRKRRIAESDKTHRTTHLEASQKIAHVGSWELELLDVNDLNTNPLYWSEETYRIFGYEPKETKITNDLFFQAVPPDEKAAIEQTLKKALETGTVYDIEHRIITLDGVEKIVKERAETIIDPVTGRQLKMIGTVQDITNNKKAEALIKKANYELKTLFESMQECVFTVDATTLKLIQISPSCEEIYGYTVEEFMQDHEIWIRVVLDEDRAIILSNHSNLEKGEATSSTYRILDKRGKVKWIETKVKPTLDKEGKLVRLDGVTADITKRKEAEIALTNSEYRFRSLIENSADAIIIVNERSEIVYASDSLYKIMGYHPAEVIGLVTFGFTHPDDVPVMQEYLQQLLQNPSKTLTAVYRRRKKDESYIWCEGSATNLLHIPSINGIIVNFRDVTERKMAEEALEISNEELKKTNNELDKFVYSVSHDLRAPLSSMLGIVSLIESETTDMNIMVDTKLLKQSINKLDGFIIDILDYSRNSRMEVNIEEIHFLQMVEGIKDNLKHMASVNSKVDIIIDIHNDYPFYSDPTRLNVIFINLISNAIRYSTPQIANPFVEISIYTSEIEAVIKLKDNGIGIAKENQGKIFDMFYRISKKSVGSGLGLYIVKETVEKLNGNIQLDSELGKGSQFIIHLPNSINF